MPLLRLQFATRRVANRRSRPTRQRLLAGSRSRIAASRSRAANCNRSSSAAARPACAPPLIAICCSPAYARGSRWRRMRKSRWRRIPAAPRPRAFAGYRAAGVNRLSIGVQSFDGQRVCAALGRVHDARECARGDRGGARSRLRRSLNLDLMHGLPGQTNARDGDWPILLSRWHHARGAPVVVPAHAGAEHGLPSAHPPPTAEPRTHWPRSRNTGRANCSLQPRVRRSYEVSAWARPRPFRCRHNLNYWHFGDYLGIGAGAHGKLSLGKPAPRAAHPASTRVAQPTTSPAACKRNRYRRTPPWRPAQLALEFLMNALRLPDGTTRRGIRGAHRDSPLATIADPTRCDLSRARPAA
jgi:hypothetical protein